MRTLLHRITPETKSLLRNYRKVKEGCECPEPKPKYEIVEEKRCPQCSFVKWRPKPRKLLECEVKKAAKSVKQPVKCYAGMSFAGKAPACKYDDIDPFKKKCCLKHGKDSTKKETARPSQIQIPAADWDMDCKP